MYGVPTKKACEIADIPYAEYLKMVKDNRQLSDELDMNKNILRFKAMQNIADKILEGNITESKYFLEKCCDFHTESSAKSKKETLDINNRYESKLKKLSQEELKEIVFYEEKN